MQNELFTQGMTLLLLGMGVVYTFLGVLVVTSMAMSAIVNRYFPAVLITPTAAEASVNDAVPDARTMAIIHAAISQHRNSH